MELLKQNDNIKVMAKFYELKQTGNANVRLVVLNRMNHCVCCGVKDVEFIKIKNCLHNGFLRCYFEKRINISLSHVCHYCHGMLKKIDDFKKQVERCLTMAEALLYHKPNLTVLDKPIITSIRPKKRMIETLMIEDKLSSGLRRKETPSIRIENTVTPQVNTEVEHDTNMFEMEFDVENQIPTVVVTKDGVSESDVYESDRTKEWDGPKLIKTISLSDLPPPLKRVEIIENSRTQKTKEPDLDEKIEGKVQLVFLNREELEKEREAERKMKKYLALPVKCEDCVVSFGHQDSLTMHMRKHDKTKGDFTCDICKCVYSSEDKLGLHRKAHSKRFKCVPCGRMFKECAICIDHYNTTHGTDGQTIDVVYECKNDNCDFKCSTYNEHRKHIRSHREKPACPECGKRFANKTNLNLHVRHIHYNDHRIYKCRDCGKEYKAHGALLDHIRNAHVPMENKPLCFCKICGRQYKNKFTLATHLKTHPNHTSEESKRFICDICGKRFIIKWQIRDHIQTVHLKSQFKCEICGAVCNLEKSLKRHKRTAHSTNPVPKPKILCHLCGKEFTTSKTLQGHMRTHTGERPFKCDTCDATFRHAAGLYTHRRMVHKHPRDKDRVRNDSQNK